MQSSLAKACTAEVNDGVIDCMHMLQVFNPPAHGCVEKLLALLGRGCTSWSGRGYRVAVVILPSIPTCTS